MSWRLDHANGELCEIGIERAAFRAAPSRMSAIAITYKVTTSPLRLEWPCAIRISRKQLLATE